jgi:glyoxylase-like metal-dependent hydrolase (beta-lactamase superfamily II)
MIVVRRTAVGPFAANAYLVACDRTREAVLVDAGDDAARLLALRQPGDYRIGRIFLTHGHPDHLAAVAAVREATGAPVTLHAGDAYWRENFQDHADLLGIDAGTPPRVDRAHEDGETLEVGELRARVIHTPGHSAGGCCLFFPAEKVLFTGDTLFTGSVGRTDLPGGDLDALIPSIRERLFTLGDDVRFYPGHGAAGLIGEERRTNPFAGEPSRRGRFP